MTYSGNDSITFLSETWQMVVQHPSFILVLGFIGMIIAATLWHNHKKTMADKASV